MRYYLLYALCSLSFLRADLFEGFEHFLGGGSVDIDMLRTLLPYNPIIVEAGALYGNETVRAARLWPEGSVFAFEPNPRAFSRLGEKIEEYKNVEIFPLALSHFNGHTPLYLCYGMSGDDPAFEYASSLLPPTPEMELYCRGAKIEIPCVVLDDWCLETGIDHIDVLRLDVGGYELPVLASSPNILKSTKAVYVRTLIHPHRIGMTQYNELKQFLVDSDFVLISHWYQPEISGHAIFISREIFDAYFKLCLGIYQWL